MQAAHLLLVEDDAEIRGTLAEFLRGKGYVVDEAETGEQAMRQLEAPGFDLVLLDVMLPGMDGLEVCRRIRAKGGPRIIMLTALGEATDKVVGLEMGADDYVTKPFDLRELLARVRAMLRRPAGDAVPAGGVPAADNGDTVLRFAGFSFFPYRRFVRSAAGVRILLTGTETDLLLALCKHPRQVLSRDELIALTRGEAFPISARSVDLLVSRLRRKLATHDPLDNPIRTVRADGYVLHADVVQA
ncbi:response regulator transcription factor [Luteibacter aegosomatissinici]|uniref:response regulator transcription factor n=1 Tax=Luteibacter aegosomatissinici TaxID=2911539 RepID=UPI001FFBE0E9|nr:response regulator transcription factor [Luteibacter aegosomatissinici]UPG94153.1 response regulator transcription factor [Luteibacter aegosomatissinici]